MIQLPKGTKDILPDEMYKWKYFYRKIEEICRSYRIEEIKTPVFEYTELFQRGVGETTDVVQKEMYTFDDKGGRSITLRPEGTAGVARSYIENGMGSKPGPIKLYYAMQMYRYENVQKGRYREFNQLGIEYLNTQAPSADVEIINVATKILDSLKITDVIVEINSIGCPVCRKKYQEILKSFFKNNLENYCETCQNRFEKNPMRILDCKEEKCKKLNKTAPSILDYLCEECREHFEKVKSGLNELNIKYVINPKIVRGLDYYTKTVFEIISKKDGFAVLAGGRYDGLIEEIGGAKTACIGFAAGIERILSLIDEENLNIEENIPELYIATIGEEAENIATKIVSSLREKNIICEKDISGRSLKAQFKYADKIKAKYCITIGEEEIRNKVAKIKLMSTGEEETVGLSVEDIISKLS